jgi:1-acyl-sn-glycerol-3-phosphate acyltransferase
MTRDDRPARPIETEPAAGEPTRLQVVLEMVREMLGDLHPERAAALAVRANSDFDRELGFDSLARVELLARINDAFAIELAESVLETAESPADLAAAVAAARPRVMPRMSINAAVAPVLAAAAVPAAAVTLVEVLNAHAAAHGERAHVHLQGEAETATVLTYGELLTGARSIAMGLRRLGLAHGSSVALMLPTGRDYLFTFFGVLLAGCVPVPIYPPTRAAQIEEHLRRHARILGNAEARLLVTVAQARRVARLLQAKVAGLDGIMTSAELTAVQAPGEHEPELPVPRADDVAFLQYTSGSTGDPKGVILTHAHLLANIRAMGEAIEAGSGDVFVSWLPLYHDMGLIGAWLGSLYYGIPLVLMSPLSFLTSPGRWLRAIHRYRATLTAAPNFAFELCLKRLRDADLEGLDLSSLRLACNGAEPVSPNTVRRFAARFACAGWRATAMTPVYGLAESAVGLSFTPLDRGPMIDRIERDRFLQEGKAVPAAVDAAGALEFVGAGRPLPGYRVMVVDAHDQPLPDRQQGRLLFQGPSATSGYFRNPAATAQLLRGDWLDTGDLAYRADGTLYITGRVKDTIIRGGRNLYPSELEEAVGQLPGIRAGCVAVIGAAGATAGTEQVVVVAETRETDAVAREALIRAINGCSVSILGAPPDNVVLVSPHSVLKTSSGKIRRSAVRALYQQGTLGRASPPPLWQFLRVTGSGLRIEFARLQGRVRTWAFAAWAHTVFWSMAPLAWLLVALVPGPRRRWILVRGIAAGVLVLLGMRPRVDGMGPPWPAGPCVLVSNHASYVDAVVLFATLPQPVRFVAKAEFATQFIAGTFLRRLGAAFVERFDTRAGAADARSASALLTEGAPLLFFPEGTFTRAAGLRTFRSGAFVVAAEQGVPVIPVVLAGTRGVLPGASRFPQRRALRVWVGAPQAPAGRDWAAAMQLRATVRALMLEQLDEPDLARAGSDPAVGSTAHGPAGSA